MCLGRGFGVGEGEVVSALLAVCFFTMARLSSLVPESAAAFDPTRQPILADLQPEREGFRINLKWSKTRQVAAEANWTPLLPVLGSAACSTDAARFLRGRGRGLPRSSPLFSLPGSRSQGTSALVSLTIPQARKWLGRLLWALGEMGGSLYLSLTTEGGLHDRLRTRLRAFRH